ncbi:MAG: response regulator [Acidobacteriota bacterium]
MFPLLKRKARLLLLDDDVAMQRLISLLLQRHGYRVDVVSAGAQAIEKINQFEYAAMLLDLMTPTEGGLTVIRHLKEVKPASLQRIILVTASPPSVLKSVENDVAAIIQKPFVAEDLLATVQRVVALP